MPFRNDRQRGLVCATLCSWIPASPWFRDELGAWRPRGDVHPTKCLSTGEVATIRLARAVWGGAENLEIWLGWDRLRMRDALTMLIALGEGPAALDRWILEQQNAAIALDRQPLRDEEARIAPSGSTRVRANIHAEDEDKVR